MKKLIMKRFLKILLAVALVVSCFAGVGSNQAEAAQNSLKVRVGFYGGPYYDIHTFSYSEMCELSDYQVYTYSGADSGGFMRIAYAWGVRLSDLVDAANVDLNSVKYFHMSTADSYGEGKTTFSVGTLLNTSRYFFPNMVKMVMEGAGDQQAIRFDEVTEEHTSGAQRVPTILAIGSTDYSRAEAVRVGLAGEYPSYSTGDLPQDHQYRLMFGQTGLSSANQAANAQTSDKWVTAIDIQLAGAPNITVDKTLVSGEDGKVGSKYSVKLNADLPSSYSYIPDSVRQQLINDILEDVSLGDYDDSVINVTQKSDGSYVIEVVGEGTTDLNFAYSRSEYGGETTSTGASTSISGSGSGSGSSSGSTDKDESGTDADNGSKPGQDSESGAESNDATDDNNQENTNGDSQSGEDDEEETQIGFAEEILPNDTKKEQNDTSKPTTEITKGKKWMSIGDVVLEEVLESGADQALENEPIVVQEETKNRAAGIGSVACLGFGFAATMITYYKRR